MPPIVDDDYDGDHHHHTYTINHFFKVVSTIDIVFFQPKSVVEGALAAIAPSLEEKGLVLHRLIPAATGIPVRRMGDPNRLHEIQLNLLNIEQCCQIHTFRHSGSVGEPDTATIRTTTREH
jgi:hypothetical protein